MPSASQRTSPQVARHSTEARTNMIRKKTKQLNLQPQSKTGSVQRIQESKAAKQELVHEHEICIRIDSGAYITTLHPSTVRQLRIDPSSLPTIRHQKESHLLEMTFIIPGSSEEVSYIAIISNKAPHPTISLVTLIEIGVADNQAFLLEHKAKFYKMKTPN